MCVFLQEISDSMRRGAFRKPLWNVLHGTPYEGESGCHRRRKSIQFFVSRASNGVKRFRTDIPSKVPEELTVVIVFFSSRNVAEPQSLDYVSNIVPEDWKGYSFTFHGDSSSLWCTKCIVFARNGWQGNPGPCGQRGARINESWEN